ncbi:MAG: hypothetical protein ACFFD4_34005, partial [Candidatus Odinarchaeota archaeon]
MVTSESSRKHITLKKAGKIFLNLVLAIILYSIIIFIIILVIIFLFPELFQDFSRANLPLILF